jgi:hypothetical protein
MLQIKYNGEWVNWKKAYIQTYTVFADGNFMNGFGIGNAITQSGHTQRGRVTQSGDYLVFSVPGANSSITGSLISPKIDITNYSTLHIEYSYGGNSYSKNLDISSYSGENYIQIAATASAGGSVTCWFGVGTSEDANSYLTYDYFGTAMSLGTQVSISTIYVS